MVALLKRGTTLSTQTSSTSSLHSVSTPPTANPPPFPKDEKSDYLGVMGLAVFFDSGPRVFCETRGNLAAMAFFADNSSRKGRGGTEEASVFSSCWDDEGNGVIILHVGLTPETDGDLSVYFGANEHIPLKLVSERYRSLVLVATHDPDQEIPVRFDPTVLDSILPIASVIVVPRSQDEIAALSGDTDMDLTAFWCLMEWTHAIAGGDCAQQMLGIEGALSLRSDAEVLAFSRLLRLLVADLYRDALQGVVRNVDRDAFRSFRYWLVMQGNATYTRLLDNPRILPDLMASWGLTQNRAYEAMGDVATTVLDVRSLTQNKRHQINSAPPIDSSTAS